LLGPSIVKRPSYIVALDIGTTGTRGLLCSIEGRICHTESRPHSVYYEGCGKVEQDPDEILHAVVSVIRSVIDRTGIDPVSILSVAFGGVMHSIIPLDREGTPLCRALIWADSRSILQSEQLKSLYDSEHLKLRTGCTMHPLYHLPRLLYIKEEKDDLFQKTRRFVSIKEYVVSRLYGEFVIDRSTASATGVWNVQSFDWDRELLGSIGVEPSMLSRVRKETYLLNELRSEYASSTGLRTGTPAVLGGADGTLAHIASTALAKNRLSLTVGSTAAMRKMVYEPTVLKGGEAWCYYLAEGRWLLGGVIHDAGTVMQWLSRTVFGMEGKEDELFEFLNREASLIPPGAEGLLFFPFLAGERSPRNNPRSRGAIYGLSLNHKRRHIIRALIEGIAYRVNALYEMLREGKDMEIAMSGGILGSPVWLQTLSDFLGKKLLIPKVEEASAYGAFLVALRALGVIENLDQVKEYIVYSRNSVSPDSEAHRTYKDVLARYEELYSRIFDK
jgi:gluconokinase